MKPSHIRTPRSLADATFEVGHHEVLDREFNRTSWWILGIGVAFILGLLMGVFGK